jgi:hypothetical protein
MKKHPRLLLTTLSLSVMNSFAGELHRLPSGPEGPGPFGAYQTTLKYDPAWDEPWRIGDEADVVIRFDDGGHRFVFWHGTSYIPHWVTDNGIWYNNEFIERAGHASGLKGCIEPMSDKQCRYSHVRVLESNDARVVVHWRYAPVDVEYQHAFADEKTGWTDWVDEIYTIYPDATGVREITHHSTKPGDFTEWHEAIMVNQPGTLPDDNINMVAVTLANIKGESRDYSWPRERNAKNRTFHDMPEGPCIQMLNLKSSKKPFTIVDPEGLNITVFSGNAPGSIFHHWDHWPVSQDKNWSRAATSKERPSHSSFFNLRDWKEYDRTDTSITRLMLHGLTDKPAAALAPLAKSWLTPPEIKVDGDAFESAGFDQTERAWQLAKKPTSGPVPLNVTIEAGADHPVVNPAFVVKNWGDNGAALTLDGKSVPCGKEFRYGHRRTLEGTDLIVWLKRETVRPLTISITPTGSER